MRFDATIARFDRIEQSMLDLNRSIKRLRWIVIAAGIGEVVFTVAGVAFFNAVVLPRILAAQAPSKEVVEFEARIRRQHAESAAMLDDLRQQLQSRPPKR